MKDGEPHGHGYEDDQTGRLYGDQAAGDYWDPNIVQPGYRLSYGIFCRPPDDLR